MLCKPNSIRVSWMVSARMERTFATQPEFQVLHTEEHLLGRQCDSSRCVACSPVKADEDLVPESIFDPRQSVLAMRILNKCMNSNDSQTRCSKHRSVSSNPASFTDQVTLPATCHLTTEWAENANTTAVLQRHTKMTMDLPRNAYSWPPASVRPAMTPPLTPPEKNGFSWNVSSNYATLNPGLITTSLEGEQTMPAIPTGQSSSQTVRPSNIQLPSGESFSRRSDPGTWLSRALRNLGEILWNRA